VWAYFLDEGVTRIEEVAYDVLHPGLICLLLIGSLDEVKEGVCFDLLVV
jgi:hypothetical protein